MNLLSEFRRLGISEEDTTSVAVAMDIIRGTIAKSPKSGKAPNAALKAQEALVNSWTGLVEVLHAQEETRNILTRVARQRRLGKKRTGMRHSAL